MDLQAIEREALEALERAASLEEVESLQIRFLGRKEGRLTAVLRSLGALPADEKKRLGQEANRVRVLLEERIGERQRTFERSRLDTNLQAERVDLTLPGRDIPYGHSHLILKTIDQMIDIFRHIGFDAVEGPEVEFDQFNFTDLNIPADHPARDMHDTFYLQSEARVAPDAAPSKLLLRTHTSPVQVRLMRATAPPVRIVSPGRVFRHEATDATHAAIFHQFEGLAVDRGISFADLKGTLTYFAQHYFGSKTKVRFNPSYFPFVEPGAQMDVQCFVCGGSTKGPDGAPCGLCKATGWMEIMGAGMVHPQVLRNVGYDPEEVSGFAFGMGVERIVMARYGVRDIRQFLDSDLRFLEQFR